MIAALDAWPVIASDPGWEMRRGPESRATTPSGEVVLATLTWTSDAGIAAEIEMDGVPIGSIASLTLDQLTAVEKATSVAASTWRTIQEGNH